jgi:hypothetical protein
MNRRQTFGAPMDDLTARLLLRIYAAAYNECHGAVDVDRFGAAFRKDIDQLIAEFGQAAVNAALDKLPDGTWPSVAMHWPP